MIRRCHLEVASSERIGTTDAEWAVIGPLLPAERGHDCRPAGDNRPFFDGMTWMAKSDARWRHLPDEYGKWNSVFRRYRRWAKRGGFSTKLHPRCHARGLPLGFVLASGQAHDIQGFGQLFRMIGDRTRMPLADRSYDAGAIRAEITFINTRAAIPAKRGCRCPALPSQATLYLAQPDRAHVQQTQELATRCHPS